MQQRSQAMWGGRALGLLAVVGAVHATSTPKRGFAGFVAMHCAGPDPRCAPAGRNQTSCAGLAGCQWRPVFSCSDARALGLEGGWFYTWMSTPSHQNFCQGQSLAHEFVPMINGVGQASRLISDRTIQAWRAANARFLLGYNEPDSGNGKHNHPHQASPAAAASDWIRVQAVAGQFSPALTLVAPAVASSAESGGADAWDPDGRSLWMDWFLGNCTRLSGCDPSRIKYIAMHDYHGNLTALKRRIQGAHRIYGRPIWLTEFAHTSWGNPPGRAKQNSYLQQALEYLDAAPEVYRYAWYGARNEPDDQNGGSNMLPYDNNSTALTSTGMTYALK